ncbi:MAG: hypothetical protein HC829_05055, partial [Bacteroidales bacterium]|nr:hypothetical protein [Bacteroidales bacterium]
MLLRLNFANAAPRLAPGFAIGLALAAAACTDGKAKQTAEEPRTVRVEIVHLAPLKSSLTLTGTVRARHEIPMAFRVSGRPGDWGRPGWRAMTLDSRALPWVARTALPLALVLALAVWFRFHEIGRLPLWLDEAYSFWFSGQSFRSLWTFVPTFETHPPVYYSLLRLWRVFGEDETALRSLSAVLGILATAAVYLLGR